MEKEKTAGAHEARREEWRRIIAEQQAGGQGAAAYCRERAIPVWKFSYWRKALAPAEASASPSVGRVRGVGALPIDNNSAEQMIRPVALGRNNWLFFGSERGG